MATTNTLGATLSTFRLRFGRISQNQPALLYPAVLAGAGVVAVGSFALARAAWTDYKIYLGYGPGGMPYNVFGWLLTNTLRALSIDMLDVRKFDTDPDQRTWLRDDRGPTAPRAGPRPTLGPHGIPQRQLDQFAPEEIQQTLLAAFASLVAHNPTLIETKPSKYERHHGAIWVADTLTVQTADLLGYPFSRETAHVHSTADSSVHVILSPKDAAKVVRAGWGQLHSLAGVSVSVFGRKVVPKSYVLLYAPRDEHEVKVVMDIVRAAVAYMAGVEWDEVNPA
ncbi:hypothetical protein A1O3_00163 [Capronia epimyces CBS 606.96]|uniref:Luciferase domain-containing protein n=1 Tax=Capronia epimyces CBS 606.96 TaxID=1182542 RepID=W9YPL2_9EURO|nr:uncharacterized protein A1O3_00163 [Capronia epimyces CBS 606.96]EXJ91615.1 hypothetical protein A1O3_00163 [Capronia epimyces CBS 606.96]